MLDSYITFQGLGQAADLGSQIQQYASMYAIAKHTGKQIVFPESSVKAGWGLKFQNLLKIPITIWPDYKFADFVPINPTDGLLPDSKVFQLEGAKNYIITNLLHTYHYWYPDDMHDVYGWDWNPEHYAKALELHSKLKETGKELVAIHVRRGDYLKHDHFCKLDVRYYSPAISEFLPEIEKYHFVVFSNDIQWCKDNLLEESELVTFLDQGVDYVDMILMSLCDHNIIANSSFSWWAAFRNRNPNKRIICPKNYIRSYSPYNFLNGNYYLPTWSSIDNDVL